MFWPPIWMLKLRNLAIEQVTGALEIGELVGDGKAPVGLDKKGIYNIQISNFTELNIKQTAQRIALFFILI